MGTNSSQLKKRSKGVSASWVILGCFLVAFIFFFGFCGFGKFWPGLFESSWGNAEQGWSTWCHFHMNDVKKEPSDFFGTLYTGGFVIPIVITLLLTVLTLSVERIFAMNRASGKGKVDKFVIEAKKKIATGDFQGAEELCDKQKGSVANILKAALVRYKDVESYKDLNNDQKAEIIQKEIEDATTLELPYLEQNLSVIATISTLGTLFGLLGTVLGMIRSFAAMGQEGAPDSTQLAIGISEALYNTALGIATGALAIISYNYFAGRVQDTTNAVDEVGFAMGQTYTATH